MQVTLSKSFPVERWCALFIVIHVVSWTLIPALIRYNLPLDSVEGAAVWGHQLLWGYDKNPFLNAWLSKFAITIGGEWTLYFFCQLSVAACFWSVWKLGSKILTPTYALLAVLMLEGMQYVNFHALDFNDNVLELGLWALSSYFFYQALTTKTKSAWLLTGIFSALGVMAKYYTFALLGSFLLFLLFNADNRKQLTRSGFYLACSIFLIITAPHIIWLFSHDFITIKYVFLRTSTEPSWLNHLFFPAQFAWQQLQVFIPVLIFYGCLFIGKQPRTLSPALTVSQFDKQFLFFIALMPFLLTLLLSFITGAKLRAGWGMPLLSFWSLILLAWKQPRLSEIKIMRFIAFIFIFLAVLLSGYVYSIVNSKNTSSANFPGKEIAEVITQKWHQAYGTKLEYVAGSRWLGGNIELNSPDHPAVFMEWNTERSPWIKVEEIKKKGAIFIWDIDGKESLPDAVRTQYPNLQPAEVLEFEWKRNRNNLAPMKIGVAILPPG